MQLTYSFILLAAGYLVVRGQSTIDCGVVGNKSGVICISETEYKLSFGDTTVYSCPIEAFCVNHPNICLTDALPVCRLSRTCNQCKPNSVSTCVDAKRYVTCLDGQLDTNIRNCQASKPYCSLRYDDNSLLSAVCTNVIEQVACDGSTTEPNIPDPGEPFECGDKIGKFPDLIDLSCKRYYYCYPDEDENGNQKISKEDFMCPIDTVYNRDVEKCVKKTDKFVCPNQ
ncbi:unnamed protein product [Hermetia illucens]|uniref:Chitin-binding type-2 domain-containing protein n=1 Tax=Hermetia illucens TaxID=343691 RepID=A0A7R8UK92_HERIL|nr:uncharacterized protein LOC119649196 [Hermetia illucens]CAD7082225.1 unnamed protein product [Hermetia illucens]